MAGKNKTAFASAVRTASSDGPDMKNNNSVGCHMIIDMTVISSEGSVTLDSGESDKATGTIQLASAVSLVAASGTLTCSSAVANTFSTGTVTLASALANTFSTGTVTCATAIQGNTAVINGNTYTGVDGSPADATEFSVDTGNNETAISLANAVNTDVRVGTLADVSASPSAAVVTLTTTEPGVGGDATTLVSSGATLAVSGATFSGGVDADFCTINGNNIYTATNGSKAGDNTLFDISGTDIQAAADLVDSITNDVRSGVLGSISAANGGTAVVTCTTDVDGVAGDAVTLTSSDGVTLAVSGATFGGGVDADFAVANNLTYVGVAGVKSDNTEFSIDTSDDACAADLALSITNDSRTGVLNDVTATDSTGVVTCTQTVAGAAGNATTLVGSTNITASAGTFANGTDADFAVANGLTYTAVAGARPDNITFSIDTSDIAAATDLSAAITADTRTGTLNDLSAVSGGTDTVTATTSIGGTVGNSTTLASSDEAGRLTISGSTFTGGLDNALVSGITVDSVEIMSGTEIFVTDLPTTATNIAANITAFTSVPNYNAVAVGAKIEIESESGADGLAVVATSVVIATTDVNANANDITFTLQGKDTLSGEYYDILESVALNAVATTVLRVHPSLTVSSNTIAKDGLPQIYRVQAEHADDSPVTYSVAINLLN
jgi:hypothetical protein